MLVAITDQNKRLVLQTSMSKDLLKQLRNERHFFCPQCKMKLQLKVGTMKVPHFAHLTNNACESQFSEGETEQHILGKEHLFHLLNRLGLQVELESYLPSLKQRPDLLVQMENGKRFAIEYQCSPISEEYLMLRNQGYLSINVKPIWIPCTPTTNNVTAGIMIISLSKQLQQFVLTTHNQRYLLTYNPRKQHFIYFSNLLHVKGNQFLTNAQHLPLEQQIFPFYLPKNITKNDFLQYYRTYHHSMERYLRNRLFYSNKGVKDLFLQSVYELRLTLTTLPLYLGVPFKGNELLGLFAVEWQTALFYFMQINCLEINTLDRQAIQSFLKWAKLNVSRESISIVNEYCSLLKQLNIGYINSSVNFDKLIDLLYTQFLA